MLNLWWPPGFWNLEVSSDFRTKYLLLNEQKIDHDLINILESFLRSIKYQVYYCKPRKFCIDLRSEHNNKIIIIIKTILMATIPYLTSMAYNLNLLMLWSTFIKNNFKFWKLFLILNCIILHLKGKVSERL